MGNSHTAVVTPIRIVNCRCADIRELAFWQNPDNEGISGRSAGSKSVNWLRNVPCSRTESFSTWRAICCALHPRSSASLQDGLGERAMQIHLQRIVGAYVGSAHGAGQFYSRAVTEARDATAKSACDARDEDVDGPVGFDGPAQRKREFAADMGVQAHALLMAAEGAVTAYEQVIGERWKPFERAAETTSPSVDRKAAAAQMAAFG